MTTITDFFEYLTGQVDHQPWRERANCRGLDPALFFGGRGEPTTQAREVCRACEVRCECLEVGMSEHFGLWGGLSERQRRLMRRTGMHTNGHVA